MPFDGKTTRRIRNPRENNKLQWFFKRAITLRGHEKSWIFTHPRNNVASALPLCY